MLEVITEDQFEQVYAIMKQSFPSDEIRNYDGQLRLMAKDNYKIYGIREGCEIVGIVAVWQFELFTFIEHLAIMSKYRNGGYGSKILTEVGKKTTKKVILEVEYATDRNTKRRIKFYEKNGYRLYDFNYIMPAFSQEQKPVPLCLMSNSQLSQSDFEIFYEKIKNQVNI